MLRRAIKFVLLLLAALSLSISPLMQAQTIKIGYDKSTDFSKYKSYTWAEQTLPSTRPLLSLLVMNNIDDQLRSKGLVRVEEGGALLLNHSGGIDYGMNQDSGTPIVPRYGGPPPRIDANMWTGANGTGSMTIYVPEGTLIVELVEQTTGRIVWRGSVRQKLNMERKTDSIKRIEKAIAKLFKNFPPRTEVKSSRRMLSHSTAPTSIRSEGKSPKDYEHFSRPTGRSTAGTYLFSPLLGTIHAAMRATPF